MEEKTGEIKISLVLAMAKNGVIGVGNRLPWHLPSELKRFRQITIGHPVVMGRQTFESIGRPLPGRDNIVMTRAGIIDVADVHSANSLEDACSMARQFAQDRGVDEIMIIGGGDVFEQIRDRADKVYLTTVNTDVEGDTVFRPLNASNWTEISSEDVEAGPDDTADFNISVYERN